MRRICLTLLTALALSLPATAQENAAAPAIEDVIADQMRAFRSEDVDTAFTFASPGIKGLFQTPERFGAMVRQGYPMVYRNAEVGFLDLREIDGALWQKVTVRDASGAYHVLDYQMIRTEGGWQIDGVRLLRQPQVGA